MENQWAWRELTDTGSTRGPGLTVNGNWRIVKDHGKKSPRITHPPDVSIQFLELSGPSVMLEDLQSGEQLGSNRYAPFIEVWGQQVHTAGWDTESSSPPPLRDGDILQSGNRLFRVFTKEVAHPTARASLDVNHKDCHLDIDLLELTASFTVNSVEALMRQVCARCLSCSSACKFRR